MEGTAKAEQKPNPRSKANPLSALFFCWTLPTFMQGYRRDLELTDLTKPLKEHTSSLLGDKLSRAWEKELERCNITDFVNTNQNDTTTASPTKVGSSTDKKGKKMKPSLLRALTRVFGLKIMLCGIFLCFIELFVRVVQPQFISGLISYYATDNTMISELDAYLYALGVIMCSVVNVLCTHTYGLAIVHLGMQMRVACVSVVYRKALRLSRTALGDTTAGQVVNLLSNDVSRFDVAVIFMHYLWIGPLETVLVTYLMYREVGISAVIGVACLLLFIPLQAFLGKRTSSLRLRTALRTDERVRLMNEIITGIQVIKMYAWEKPFAYMVSLARRREIKEIRGTSYIRGILLSFIMFTTRLSVFVTLVAYVLLGYVVTAQKAFVLTSYYNVLRQTMTVFFPQGIGQVAEGLVSVGRLEKFMTYDETPLSKNTPISQVITDQSLDKLSDNNSTKTTTMAMTAPNGISQHKTEDILSERGVTIRNACARWTEDQTEETLSDVSLNIHSGSLVAVIGPVGAGKSSLLHAILGELPLKSGSISVQGTISYGSQEPWLFAGSVRQNILFGQPMERDRYKLIIRKCALERDFALLPYGDKTIVGDRGASLSGGQRARISLARAVYRRADLYLLDDPLSAVDAHVGRHLFDQCIEGLLKSEAVILITHQLQYLKHVDKIIILNNGRVEAQGTYDELGATGLDFAKLLAGTSETEDDTDDSEPVKVVRSRQHSLQSVNSFDDTKNNDAPSLEEETRASGSVGAKVYGEYLKAGGGFCTLFVLLASCILAQIAGSGGDYFLTYWVNLEELRSIEQFNLTSPIPVMKDPETSFWDLSRENCIYIYSGITILTIVITVCRSIMFFWVAMRASMNLHDGMFSGITRASMYFFNTNPAGRILNRFSKDMGSIDEMLPSAMIDCLQIGLTLLGIIIVVAVVNFWLLIPTILVGFIFYFLRNFYLATSRSVKRLEGTTRSPVFSHLAASLAGLPTIRAFGAQLELAQEFDAHQDLHSAAWYMFIATSRAFGFWLDVVCIVYITIVTLSFLVLGNENFGGNVGLAVTQAIGLTGMFQWGMRQSAELENQMVSVERVLEYKTVDAEKELDSPPDKKPPPDWPSKGRIVFKDVQLRYAANTPPVLKGLNFIVNPAEKVGIVGRTGAGKSSLINALFRLSLTEGHIIIDDRDTADMGLHDLRSKIAIIPQEPVLFSGTMRYNLDPFDEFKDDQLWQALDEVKLKEAVSELPAGLASKMSEGGGNFSVGQRQLVCLARAILRDNKILVLDEATANVDPQTDALIQATIRNKFLDCTVLTIAHRLHTVMDCDKVMVMDAGTILEFGHPFELLQKPNGTFKDMLEQTGRSTVEALTRVAEQSYKIQVTSRL